MKQNESGSDLIDVVHHEHAHLCKLFDDIAETFEKMGRGDIVEARRSEVVEVAREDLEGALEDMLHHFNQEEEVVFLAIENQFPQYADEIAALTQVHELICERTRWLHRQLRSGAGVVEQAGKIVEVLVQLRDLVHDHAINENRLFDEALERMPPAQREELRDEMRRL